MEIFWQSRRIQALFQLDSLRLTVDVRPQTDAGMTLSAGRRVDLSRGAVILSENKQKNSESVIFIAMFLEH